MRRELLPSHGRTSVGSRIGRLIRRASPALFVTAARCALAYITATLHLNAAGTLLLFRFG